MIVRYEVRANTARDGVGKWAVWDTQPNPMWPHMSPSVILYCKRHDMAHKIADGLNEHSEKTVLAVIGEIMGITYGCSYARLGEVPIS